MQITLRPFEPRDADALAKYANNYNISKNLTNKFPFPYTKKDAEIFITWALSHNPLQVMAIEIDRDVIGSIGIHPLADIYAKSAELGYWIGESFWGKGIATGAIEEMLVYGFEAFDIDRVFARTTQVNLASQSALKKAGFVLEAKLNATIFKNNEYFDELIFGFRKDSLKKN
ncbi:ribosomal-protein-alanine N-acetyltransferase [Pedobacter sp. UYP30]|uniref:GNAT family N-acetyltransferase n=1 Tax=Pedobacter sp. UYP30 TaxID=1756400 RepID=UPI003391ED4A